MKRRILVRVVLVLILLLALYPLTKFVILPLFDTSGELEGHDVPLYGYSEPDTPMVMENDALRFELDPATTHFTLTDKRTGHVWLSSPDNADSDPIALPVEKNKLNSTLSLTYAASTGMTTQFTSQEHSISNGVYEVLMQEDGSVRVNYSVGRVQRSFLMPTAIGDARMQQFMEKMTSKQKKDIKEYYREYNIDKLRKTDDKAALLASVDAYIAPHTGGESFGIVLIEAMAAGAPVIASDLEAFCSVLGDTGAGVTFPVSEPAGLAERLRQVLGDDDLRARMSRAGRERAGDFDWESVAARIMAVYETVVEGVEAAPLAAESTGIVARVRRRAHKLGLGGGDT